MKITRVMALAVAAGVIAALSSCSTTTTTEQAPAPSSAAAEVAPSSSPAPSTCPEFEMTAAHMATDWQYLNLNLGTTNDEKPTLADLAAGSAALQALAPMCAPQAVESIDAFAATVEAIMPIYDTQATGDAAQEVNDALTAMSKAGVQMFTDLGRSTFSFEQ